MCKKIQQKSIQNLLWIWWDIVHISIDIPAVKTNVVFATQAVI